MSAGQFYLQPEYEEVVRFRAVPMVMFSDRIGIVDGDWYAGVVIDGEMVGQISKRWASAKPTMDELRPFIAKMVKEHNRRADIDAQYRIDDPSNWLKPIPEVKE